ncbi:hypothetical protein FFY45_06150 [Xanthomonas hortorum]|nr:hypothetical protein [Xanthomonas hortorum]
MRDQAAAHPTSALHSRLATMQTDHLDWSLPAHRRGTLCGMDAAVEPTWTYLRRVPRWWAGKDPAANTQISRSKTNVSTPFDQPLKATESLSFSVIWRSPSRAGRGRNAISTLRYCPSSGSFIGRFGGCITQ